MRQLKVAPSGSASLILQPVKLVHNPAAFERLAISGSSLFLRARYPFKEYGKCPKKLQEHAAYLGLSQICTGVWYSQSSTSMPIFSSEANLKFDVTDGLFSNPSVKV
jgi:hypothetical protein